MSGDKIEHEKDDRPDLPDRTKEGVASSLAHLKKLIPDPKTGQGCVRGGPFINPLDDPFGDPLTWPLPGSPMPGPSFDEDTSENMEKILKQMEEQIGEGKSGGGMRMNAGKLRADLIPPEWEVALADVLTQGAKKYEPRNWEKGMSWSSMVGCMKRHINKFLAGERYDGNGFDVKAGTTGCHHLAMVAWNALALMSYDLREIGVNDLSKDVQLKLLLRVNADTSDLGGDVHVSKKEKEASW